MSRKGSVLGSTGESDLAGSGHSVLSAGISYSPHGPAASLLAPSGSGRLSWRGRDGSGTLKYPPALQLRVGREALLPAVCRLQSVGGLRQWEAGTAGDSFTETGLTVQTNNQHPPLPFSNYSLHQNLLEGNTDGWSPPPEFLAGLS